MEPVTLIMICALSFGGIAAITGFIQQYLISRNQSVNRLAGERVIANFNDDLKALRFEMSQNKRFIYHDLLDDNKSEILAIDDDIQGLLQAKFSLVERHIENISCQKAKMDSGEYSDNQQQYCDSLKGEFDQSINEYDKHIERLQEKREVLLSDKQSLLTELKAAEAKQSQAMNDMYQAHGQYLDKMVFAYQEGQQKAHLSFVDSAKSIFSSIVKAPVEFVASLFKGAHHVDSGFSGAEGLRRESLLGMEKGLHIDINDKVSLGVNFS